MDLHTTHHFIVEHFTSKTLIDDFNSGSFLKAFENKKEAIAWLLDHKNIEPYHPASNDLFRIYYEENISSHSIEVLDELGNSFISYSDILENEKVNKIIDTRTQIS